MLEKVVLLNQTAAELAAKYAELLRQRLKQRSAEEALSKIKATPWSLHVPSDPEVVFLRVYVEEK